MFSFGIVLWEILTGEEPYANMHYGAIIGTFPLLFSSKFSCLRSHLDSILETVIRHFCISSWLSVESFMKIRVHVQEVS